MDRAIKANRQSRYSMTTNTAAIENTSRMKATSAIWPAFWMKARSLVSLETNCPVVSRVMRA